VLCSGSLSYSGGLIAAAKTTDCSETPCGPNDVSTCCARATAPSPSPRSSSTTSSEQQQGEPNQGAGGSGKAGGLRRALESTLNNDHSFACSTCPIGKRNKHFCCQHDLVLQIQQSLIPFFQFFFEGFYQPDETAVACLNCPSGWYQNTQSSSLCLSCVSGKFAPSTLTP
jgi:hypothetical protein